MPNWNKLGDPKLVHFTFDPKLNSRSEIMRTYNLPEAPTHRVTTSVKMITYSYKGQVIGGSGTEAVTRDVMYSIKVEKIPNP